MKKTFKNWLFDCGTREEVGVKSGWIQLCRRDKRCPALATERLEDVEQGLSGRKARGAKNTFCRPCRREESFHVNPFFSQIQAISRGRNGPQKVKITRNSLLIFSSHLICFPSFAIGA
jgi:hypothetical protein